MDKLKDKKYDWVVIAALVLLAPLGLFFIIKYRPKWWANKTIKTIAIILTVIFGLACIGAAVSQNNSSTDNTTTSTSETKTEEIKEPVKHETIRQDDATISKGQEKVITKGVEGEKTIVYEVGYKDDKEVSRKKLSETITKEPVDEVIAVGTYVAPTSSNSSNNNSSNTPQEDNNLPFKAICEDGTISYQDTPSKTDYRGMCSGHGGIKTKLGRVP